MKGVILAGGLGTRLRPLTEDTPKPMLPVVDRPIVEWVVGGLGAAGIDEVVLCRVLREGGGRDGRRRRSPGQRPPSPAARCRRPRCRRRGPSSR